MPSTHLSLHYHIVFSTKEREAWIDVKSRGDLHAFIGGCVKTIDGIPEEIKTVLYDQQTAGGLLLSVAQQDAGSLLVALKAGNVPAVEIGEVVPAGKPLIQVV